MTASSPSAVHAVASELDPLTGALTAAFADDPVQCWLFEPATDPDAARRRFLRFFTDEYFPLGHVYVEHGSAGRTGAALWAPPDRHILGEASIERLLEMMGELLGDEALPRLGELGRTMSHVPEEPHFYLGVLGVDPSHQGLGLGAVLVEPVLEACDRGGFLAHLESSNPRNIGFYERLGFRTTADFRCGGPAGPLMTVMQRRPHA